MRSQSTPSARVSYFDGFSWVSDEPVDDIPVRALSVAKDFVFLGSWVCILWVTGRKFAVRWLQTKRWSPGKHGSSTQVNCFLAVNESLMLEVTCQLDHSSG